MNEKEYSTPVYIALPIKYLEVLDRFAKKRKCSRSDLIREAVSNFLQTISEKEA